MRGTTLPYGEVRLEKEWRETSDAASYVVSFEGGCLLVVRVAM